MSAEVGSSSADVINRVTRRIFGSKILRNDVRGQVVEEIIAMAPEPEWKLCSGDWAAFDLVHATNRLRIQVKQSAARQSWHKGDCPPPNPRFSIATKAGRWEDGDKWIEERSRNAEIFVFAWHPVIDATVDHREPDQWEFYVAAERSLPQQGSISLAAVRRLSSAVDFDGLARAVSAVAEGAIIASSTTSN
jgi:hypothetical protein